MHIYDLDTPAVICDLDKLERNIQTMAAHCRQVGIPLRSHTKSHKIPEIAHMQLDSGAIGICCQKVGEAEVMVAAGIKDILIPYNIVGSLKVERLLRLARRARMTVSLDSLATAQGISAEAKRTGGSVRALIELDTGGNRCGVQSPQAALALAQQLVDLPGIDFQGIMTYPSRATAKPFLEETVTLLQENGIPVKTISGGGTGHEAVSQELGCTETRSGSYVWEGQSRVQKREDLSDDRCPLRLLLTVVSVPTPERIIIDGGLKTFSNFTPAPSTLCVDHPEITLYGLSVEHGHVDVSQSSHPFKVGDRLAFIPRHQEVTLNLHNELVGYRGEQVEVIWAVQGRGKVQ